MDNDQLWQFVDPLKTVVSTTAEDIWRMAMEYFQWSDENPLKVKKTINTGKDAGKPYYDENPRPYSLKAFCIHSGLIEDYLIEIRKTKREDSDYYKVITKILYIIYVQNSDLAQVGVYNPIFTSKLLGMDNDNDKPIKAIQVTVVQGLPSLSSTEAEVVEKIELEKRYLENGTGGKAD